MSDSIFINRRPRAVKKEPIVEKNIRSTKNNSEESVPNKQKRKRDSSILTDPPSKIRKQSESTKKDVNSNIIVQKTVKKAKPSNKAIKKSDSNRNGDTGKKRVSVSNGESKSMLKAKPIIYSTKKTQKKKPASTNEKAKSADPYSAYDFTSSDDDEPVNKRSKASAKKKSSNTSASLSVHRRVFSVKSPVVASYTFFTKGSGSHFATSNSIDTSLSASALAAKRKESVATERRQCAEATFLLPLPNNSHLPASSGSIENFMKQPDICSTDDYEPTIDHDESSRAESNLVSSTPYANKQRIKKNLLQSLEQEADLELSRLSHANSDIELFNNDDDDISNCTNSHSVSRSSHGKSSKGNHSSDYEAMTNRLMSEISQAENHELKIVAADD